MSFKSDGSISRKVTPETEVSKTIFEMYWTHAKRRIEKVSLDKEYSGHTAEFDVYSDRDLIVCEIEALNEKIANSVIPLGKDVTKDHNYKNKSLAKFDFHRKFILTGGPCSGKTSVIEYIEQLQFPIIPESARIIIEEQQKIGGSIVPWEKFLEFELEVLHISLQAEEELREWGTIFLDRGIPDAVAYCILAGFDPPTPLKDAILKQDYKAVFVLDPIPYKKDKERKESPEEAVKIHNGLLDIYSNLGFTPVNVPVNLEIAVEQSIRERSHHIVNQSHVLG